MYFIDITEVTKVYERQNFSAFSSYRLYRYPINLDEPIDTMRYGSALAREDMDAHSSVQELVPIL